MIHILVTNDDSYRAKGIRKLIALARQLGQVTVVAPDRPQSGMSHAITVHSPLRLQKVDAQEAYEEYLCNGTPVDCVKMGLKVALNNVKPSLVVSGINHGSNASTNVIYSGTMGAAIEACMEDIPSIGFSLLDYSENADFDQADDLLLQLMKDAIEHGTGHHSSWNVNIPKLQRKDIKGIKVCCQADAYWKEDYVPHQDPHHRDYYWLSGEFFTENTNENSDMYALNQGYISLVPTFYDLSNHEEIRRLAGRYA